MSVDADPGTGSVVEGKWPLCSQIALEVLSVFGEKLMPLKIYAFQGEEFVPAQENMIGKISRMKTRMKNIRFSPVCILLPRKKFWRQ